MHGYFYSRRNVNICDLNLTSYILSLFLIVLKCEWCRNDETYQIKLKVLHTNFGAKIFDKYRAIDLY